MSSISKTDRLLEVLRASAAAPVGRGKVAGRQAPARRDAGGSPARRFDLGADVVRRIAAIPPDAPRRDEQLAHAFLEGCVAQAFGADAVSDPAFQQLIVRTRETIESSAELSAAMARLVRELAA